MPEFAALAQIHAKCFTHPRPWSAVELRDLASAPGAVLRVLPGGFVLGRVTLDEAELLSIAVDPAAQRQGLGRRLMAAFQDGSAALGAVSAFLEVAEDNTAARALYAAEGWQNAGRRRGYYRTAAGTAVDALVLTRRLP
ncbi:GNAT family N-acetyltransferase [Falsigemmobacter faecalis]|uniref:GNAT family N-acetyltransferase n=1 Tax=Falsigemmobacter faecalis TaxID=2488730 RepID=A0A3P3DUY0_9RHOB|nr:GNAT family N-acetyltransferase [Falsigemmobacter faecalis]RRH77282.1 GNAT family N-acetyltransferase [Falsigemmobacter faecalis]